ncbi:hypothetical protein [Pararhodobacter zhoushanensis]|uniref:Tetratricopeptide repeat-containing protein n=1 Tax=Pararhodobacter zhoushanensis TaxID=2479545 RepID=A0ABT3H0G5_9RHOB|nr:hypothetical protein [Pararhodobacter zhoushanensis]MCW1933279.1 hypothetical protein [Pararhodobacter zhoushanensis]
MFDDALPDFALRGEAGIDLFARSDDDAHRRARFRCVATLGDDGTLVDHMPDAKRDLTALRATAEALAADPLLTPFVLADVTSWPKASDLGNPIRLFLYLDFLRAWQVADMAAARFEAGLRRAAGTLPPEAARLPTVILPILDFNQLSRGSRVARALLPLLNAQLADPAFRKPKNGGGTGYALRMLGDLCLRGKDAALALQCYETAVASGDNPFRRRRAIEAARAAKDAEALARHRAAYAQRWRLPADLAEDKDTE